MRSCASRKTRARQRRPAASRRCAVRAPLSGSSTSSAGGPGATKRRVAEKRERMLREREVQRAQQITHRLAVRAEQLERVSAQAGQSAEKAQAKALESRQVADAAAARLLELRGRS